MPIESPESPRTAATNSQHNSWRSIASWRKRLLQIGAGLAVIVTVLGNMERIFDYGRKVYSLVVPSVEIAPGVIGSDTNAFAAEFTFLNTGALPLLENEIQCDVTGANDTSLRAYDNFIIASGRNVSQYVRRLDPGKPVTRNCGELIENFFGIGATYPATFTISLSSKWPSFWQHFKWTTRSTFVGIKDSTGHVKIQPDNS